MEADAYKKRADLKRKTKDKKKPYQKVLKGKDKTAKEQLAAKKAMKEIEREAAQERVAQDAAFGEQTKAIDTQKSLMKTDTYKAS